MERSLRVKNQVYWPGRFNTIPACDGQTDEQTDTAKWTHEGSIYRASIASRGKKTLFIFEDYISLCISVVDHFFMKLYRITTNILSDIVSHYFKL